MTGDANKGSKANKKRGSKAPKRASTLTAAHRADILREQLEEARRQLREAREQQAAAADLIKIIGRSTFDLKTVLQTLVESACRLCEADMGNIARPTDRDRYWIEASYGQSVALNEELVRRPLKGKGSVIGRTALTRATVHILDAQTDPDYELQIARSIEDYHTMLGVPLMREGKMIGVFGMARRTVRPFTDRQIELVTTFADQAVIAIENVRLFDEVQAKTRDLTEALTYQTGSANILNVIASSPTDIEPVLKAIVEGACEVCDANDAAVLLEDGEHLRFRAHHGPIDINLEKWPITRGWTAGRAFLDGKPVHLPDTQSEEAKEFPDSRALSVPPYTKSVRTVLSVPLLRESERVGAILLRRIEMRPFSDKQIALLQTFADQAVIAINNARLFDDVQAKTRDLTESLEQQTATADVLKVISRSLVDLETVLETLVETVARLCGADQVYMFHLRHDLWHLAAAWGLSAEAREFFLTNPFTPGRGSTSGRAALERRAFLIRDVLQDPEYSLSEGQKIAGYRTTLGIPLLREDTLIGVFSICRTRVEAFTQKQIELATTFADQAVIAIENARLFDELRERQAELRVTFDNMGDGVVMFDAAARLTAWNRNFQEMLDLPDAFLAQRPGYAEYFRYLADRGEYSTDLEAQLSRTIEDTSQEMRFERVRPDGRVIEARRNPVPGGGFVLIYSDITERKHAEEAIRTARDAAEAALRDLQTAQDRLIQTEKLASLGQLTAGIAHEIKNPLNFVNNFSALSAELTDELNDTLKAPALTDKMREEVRELTNLLKENLQKVVQHGKRADSIVKNMLLHSREGSGEQRPSDINALVDESLNLAYHGARAEKPGFNITLERNFDPIAGKAEVYPQEITRVLLNLISNGFYAATRRALKTADGFQPTLRATTRNLGHKIEIRIRDNGMGIAPEVKPKIFNPFFTTKPAGEGTGLGLSMSHDIIVKQHGGTIEVDTELGIFTEFIITLPRT
jgi:two-component system NtrC family sensor kinase